LTALRALLATDTAGDPMGRRGLWTGLRLRQISGLLRRLGIRVCPNTVRRLLGKLGYALHANPKSLCAPCPERDRQFRYLQRQRRHFAQEQAPIISVDTKKRELIGRFKNSGRAWSRVALEVHDHDFPSLADGVAIPYGVYDVQANRGCVNVGTSRNTPAFAAASIGQWWRREGRQRYPHASTSGTIRRESSSPQRRSARLVSTDTRSSRLRTIRSSPTKIGINFCTRP
jgi:hypothetical protein